ncbi:MAG: hypothetical protein FJ044_05600, partial [Candidatus Cloacimonetes bacterium]|nr:hypothetical protein [Candidatus Cloacimonadota bacterium]
MSESDRIPKGAENWSPEVEMQYTFPDGGQPVAELKGSENTITTTIKVLEANYPRLRDFFGISPQKFEVKIVESREELDEYLCRRTE